MQNKADISGTDWGSQVRSMQPYRLTRALWVALASAIIISVVMVLGAIDPKTHAFDSDFNILYIFFSNTLLMTLLYYHNFRIMLSPTVSPRNKVVFCFVGTLALASLFSVASYYLEVLIYGQGHTSNGFLLTLIVNLTASLISFLIAALLNNVTNSQRIILENEHLQAENILNRYQTLQQQVSPHFLFNSLNTLDGLIGSDEGRAHEYLHQLAANYRYAMQDRTETTLADELEFTHSYIYMMQIRYGDNLIVHQHVSPTLLSRRMPCISLQLLVENAIKHNIISQRHPLTIDIRTADDTLSVTNTLQPKADSSEGSGIGLANLAQRYKLLFDRDISVSKTTDTFTVTIPLV